MNPGHWASPAVRTSQSDPQSGATAGADGRHGLRRSSRSPWFVGKLHFPVSGISQGRVRRLVSTTGSIDDVVGRVKSDGPLAGSCWPRVLGCQPLADYIKGAGGIRLAPRDSPCGVLALGKSLLTSASTASHFRLPTMYEFSDATMYEPIVSTKFTILSCRVLASLRNVGSAGLLRSPTYVTLNGVKGLLASVESSSRRFFAALRMTRGGFFNSPSAPHYPTTRFGLPDVSCQTSQPGRGEQGIGGREFTIPSGPFLC